MTRWSASVLLGTLLLGLLPAAPAAAEERGRPGEIELSDGTTLRGRIFFTKKAILRLHVEKTKTTHRVAPADLASLEMIILYETYERPFTWKNPGDPTKTYGEGQYPLRDLYCSLRLRDGRELNGMLISTIVYVVPEGEEKATRYKIVRQQKGKVGQTFDDLVYLEAIRYDDGAERLPSAQILGQLSSDDELEEIAAYHHGSARVYRGEVLDAAKGRFRVTGLPAGTVDLFARTARNFVHPYGPLPAAPPEGEKHGLRLSDLAGVQQATNMAADFFEERHVAALAGTRKATRAVVLKDRVGATSYEGELQGAKLWRFEVWLWHRLQTEWRIDRRVYLFRGTRQPLEAARGMCFDPALGGLEVESGGTLVLSATSQAEDAR